MVKGALKLAFKQDLGDDMCGFDATLLQAVENTDATSTEIYDSEVQEAAAPKGHKKHAHHHHHHSKHKHHKSHRHHHHKHARKLLETQTKEHKHHHKHKHGHKHQKKVEMSDTLKEIKKENDILSWKIHFHHDDADADETKDKPHKIKVHSTKLAKQQGSSGGASSSTSVVTEGPAKVGGVLVKCTIQVPAQKTAEILAKLESLEKDAGELSQVLKEHGVDDSDMKVQQAKLGEDSASTSAFSLVFAVSLSLLLAKGH
jgi:hypothetical protein